MMLLQLAFADSEVSRVEATGDTLRVVFSAASAVQTLAPARGQPGMAQGVELLLTGARSVVPPLGCFGRLAQGRIGIGGHWTAGLALPSQHAGPCRLELRFANGSLLEVHGDAIGCRFVGGPNFHESMAC